jgi:folate-binding protein YgfZ
MMTAISPLMDLHRAYARSLADAPERLAAARSSRPGAASGRRSEGELELLPWGVPFESGARDRDGHLAAPVCEIIATLGEVEPEYAAIRRGAGAFDSPHRGTLVITGKDRRDFLNRMLTQELNGFEANQTREAFWLNRKGRIDADLMLIETGPRMLIDLDLASAAGAAKTLAEFVFTEDVEIRDASSEFHHIGVHGRLARETLAAASNDYAFNLAPGSAKVMMIDGAEVVAARRDLTGEVGYELIMPRDKAAGVWEFLLATDHVVGGDKRRVRPIGWHAFNIARIEAGSPLFHIDFGPSNLPHETGTLLKQRVSFTKGCYLGQEVVARMESRGHSKATLVGLRLQRDLLPVSGSQVFARSDDGSMGEPIGAVTSSTLSPMLGSMPVAFAMIRAAQAREGAAVLVNAEGEQAAATTGPLKFWTASGSSAANGEAA